MGNPQSQCNHNAIHGIKSAHPWNLNRKLNYFKICNFHRAPVALTDVYIKLILTAIHNPSTIRVQSTVSKVHPYCKRTRWRTFNVPNRTAVTNSPTPLALIILIGLICWVQYHCRYQYALYQCIIVPCSCSNTIGMQFRYRGLRKDCNGIVDCAWLIPHGN